ncbi:MAG: DUF4192 family protein [Corynebacterium sp.]|nr:DUF4192 family protein [Corynebacterium sp.]
MFTFTPFNIANLIATVPYLLGYHPEDYLILCGVNPAIGNHEGRTEDGYTIGPVGHTSMPCLFDALVERVCESQPDHIVGIHMVSEQDLDADYDEDVVAHVLEEAAESYGIKFGGLYVVTTTMSGGHFRLAGSDITMPIGKPYTNAKKRYSEPAPNLNALLDKYRAANPRLSSSARRGLRQRAERLSLEREKCLDSVVNNGGFRDAIDRGLIGDEIMQTLTVEFERIKDFTLDEILEDKELLAYSMSLLKHPTSRDLAMHFGLMEHTNAAFSKLMLACAMTYQVLKRPTFLSPSYAHWEEAQSCRSSALALYAMAQVAVDDPCRAWAAAGVSAECSPSHVLTNLVRRVLSTGQHLGLMETTERAVHELIHKSCLSYRSPVPARFWVQDHDK